MLHKILSAVILAVMSMTSAFADTNYIVIGSKNSSNNNYPFGMNYKHSTVQSIYTSAEMGGAKTITSIAYCVANPDPLPTSKVDIYMGHRSTYDFSNTSAYENVSDMTLVYTGAPTLAANAGWEEYVLNTTFDYNGTDNLVIVVAKQASTYTEARYFSSQTYYKQCLYRNSDNYSSYGDAKSSGGYQTTTERATVLIGFEGEAQQDGLVYEPNRYNNNSVSVIYCSKEKTSVDIPSKVEIDSKTYNVTAISSYAFAGCCNLTSLSIPNSVSTIEKYAFSGCSSLKSLIIPDEVQIIEPNTFEGCSSLTSMVIPPYVYEIGSNAFTGCTSLSSLTIAENEEMEGLELGFKTSPTNDDLFLGLFYDCPLTYLYIGRNLSHQVFDNYDNPEECHGSPFESQTMLSTVEISDNVNGIGAHAFSGCSNLVSVNIPSGVTHIQDYTFYGCSSLTSIDISEKITRIGDHAFYGCSSLASINIPSATIGSYAFSGCKSLTSVKIPSGASLGQYAFEGCTGTLSVDCNIPASGFRDSDFSKVEIGSNVTSIGNDAFTNCTSLASLVIADGSRKLSLGYKTNPSNSKSFYSLFADCPITTLYLGRDLSYSICYNNDIDSYYGTPFEQNPMLTTVEIGNSVTSIGRLLFNECSNLESLTISSSVTNYGITPFVGCTGTVYVNGNVPAATVIISDYVSGAFEKSLFENVVFGEGVTSIGNNVFFDCPNLKSVSFPNGLTQIGTKAFYGCTGLGTLNLPNSLTRIDEYAFSHCSSLTSLSIPGSLTTIKNATFSGCTSLDSLFIQDGITQIGSSAFSNCSGLKVTSIPSSVTSITKGAFSGCTGKLLLNCNIPSVSTASARWFADAKFDALEIGKDVTTIGDYAFYQWTDLTSLSISNSVTNIGNNAFNSCTALSSVSIADGSTPLTLGYKSNPSSLNSSYFYGLFSDCPLATLYLGRDLKYSTHSYDNYTGYGSPFEKRNKLTKIQIGNHVTSIGNYAFMGCSGLTSINIPSSVTSIGSSAFDGCSAMMSLSIPSSVTSIGASAFKGCGGTLSINCNVPSSTEGCFYGSNFNAVEIGQDVTSIGNNAFAACTSLTSLIIDDNSKALTFGYQNNPSNSSYNYGLFHDCPLAELQLGRNLSYPASTSPFKGCNKLTSVEIGETVTSIGEKAFENCSGLATLTIPGNVTSIGNNAFNGCSSLTTLSITDDSKPLTLGNRTSFYDDYEHYYGMFEYCPLTTLYLGRKLTYSHVSPFGPNKSLTDVEIGNNVSSIENSLFKDCTALESLFIPDCITSIGQSAFSGCTRLKTLTGANNITRIEANTFDGCSNLSSFQIPDKVSYIGNYAFSGCSSLTTLTIPGKVSSIGYNAFENCSALTSVSLPSLITSIAASTFLGCSSLTSVDIPANVKSIGSSAFANCQSLQIVSIPENVTTIGRTAFYGCSGLRSTTIPNTVKSIDYYAFSGCTGTLSVNCNIEDWVFYESKFSAVEIGKDVTSIGNYAFQNSEINSLTIGAGVTSIGNKAFTNKPTKTIWLCNTPPSGYAQARGTVNYVSNSQFTSLSNAKVYPYLSSMFTDRGIKYAVVSPAERTCDIIDCTYDTTADFTIEEDVSYRGVSMKVQQMNEYAFYNNDLIKQLTVRHASDIGKYAFQDCDSIESVIISNQGEIGDYAFSDCRGLLSTDIRNNGNIGGYAFIGCSSLQTVFVGNQGDIKYSVFQNCSQIKTLTIDNVGEIWSSAFEGCSNIEDLTLGESITYFAQKAFKDCTKITSITIPNSVCSLGFASFEGCSSLATVSIGSGISSIPYSAFANTGIQQISIGENVQEIEELAFSGCNKLAEIVIPSKVSSIGNSVFHGCAKLKTLIVNDRTTPLTLGYDNHTTSSQMPLFADCPLDSVYLGGKISYNTSAKFGYSPFYRNTSLRAVEIANGEDQIYDNEFYGCSNLQQVNIGHGVTTIGNWAFSGCARLEHFSFGTNVQTIGKEAFSDCTSLTQLYSKAQVPPVCNSQALQDIDKWNCTLYVPESAIAAYKVADQWKDFFFVEINGINGTPEITPTQPETIFDINGRRIEETDLQQSGIYVVKGKKMLIR